MVRFDRGTDWLSSSRSSEHDGNEKDRGKTVKRAKALLIVWESVIDAESGSSEY